MFPTCAKTTDGVMPQDDVILAIVTKSDEFVQSRRFICNTWLINIKTKNLSVEKERSIDSKAQKKTNKITKFRINAFL